MAVHREYSRFRDTVPCPDLAGSSGLVGVNHFLERVTRATFAVAAPFELLQILLAALAGEYFYIQPRGVAVGRDEDFVHKSVDKFLCYLAAFAVLLGAAQHLFYPLHVRPKILA